MRKMIILAIALFAAAAQGEQKNVQFLTNMSDAELQRTMNMMRASLGVHCDFCHVATKEGWDFASDEKKEKKVAREMISMVLKLNKEQFGGRTEVGCNTCHRGAMNPQALVPLPQAPPPFPTPKPQRPELPPLAEIVKKYAAAVGDAAKWESRIERGTREDSKGVASPVLIEETVDKWHVAADTPAGKVEQTVVGTSGWMRSEKTGLQPLKPAEVGRFRELAAAYAPTPPSAIPPEARVVAKEKIGDHDTLVVVARGGGARQRFYFDSASGLLVRRVVITDSPVGPIPQQTDFDDWRDAGGAKYPFYVRVSLVDPWNSATRKYSEVRLGAVDAKVFAEPK